MIFIVKKLAFHYFKICCQFFGYLISENAQNFPLSSRNLHISQYFEIYSYLSFTSILIFTFVHPVCSSSNAIHYCGSGLYCWHACRVKCKSMLEISLQRSDKVVIFFSSRHFFQKNAPTNSLVIVYQFGMLSLSCSQYSQTIC